MKKLALALLMLFAVTPAEAGVTCSVPFNLQNGTTADATQVMANYNALVACFGNAAQSGVNNDITALTALTTPLTPAQGGTPTYTGGTSTGSANAQIVGVTSPATFALSTGNQVTFTAGFTPTGAMTLNVASTGATNVYRRTQLGISATVGGEFIVGQRVTVEYDGTQFQLISTAPAVVGEGKDYFGSTAPAGYVFSDGSCQLRAGVFADLFSIISTTYDPTGSTCDSAHFALPDGRGRVFAGQDNMGGIAASRLTNAGSGCTGTTLGGAGCGAQNRTIARANLPNDTVAVSITDPGHTHSIGTGGSSNTGTGGNTGPVNTSNNTGGAATGITGSIALNGGVTQTTLTTIQPLQVATKIIKY